MACLALVQCNYSGVVSIDLSIEVFHFVLLKLWLDKNASPPFFCSSSTKAGHMGENQQSAISTLESGREREGNFFLEVFTVAALDSHPLSAPCSLLASGRYTFLSVTAKKRYTRSQTTGAKWLFCCVVSLKREIERERDDDDGDDDVFESRSFRCRVHLLVCTG